MKSYTDLEQSKKLAEILLLESADMYWFRDDTEIPKIYPKNMMKDSVSVTLPCWSLAALISALPKVQGFKPIISLQYNYIIYPYTSNLYIKADNITDACYEMILELHKLKLL